MQHADHFIGLPVVSKALPNRISISEKSAGRTFVQYGGQSHRSVCPAPLIQLRELPAGQHRLAQRGKIARAYSFLDCRYLNS